MFNQNTTVEEFNNNGYVTGVDRTPQPDCERKVTHLYKGIFDDPGLPMCRQGWNRTEGYSIWRNNISKKGICKTCLRRANEGLDGVVRDC